MQAANTRRMDTSAILDAWREQGIDRTAPLRFHHVAALHRRATRQDGAAKLLLERRLASLVGTYTADMERMATRGRVATAESSTPISASGEDTMAGLLSALASPTPPRGATEGTARSEAESKPELEPGILTDFRKIWSTLLTRSQIRQSLERSSPSDAGPLNSATLVHRSLALMAELSPGYLQHFLSYADTLSWLERMGGSDRAAHGRRGRP